MKVKTLNDMYDKKNNSFDDIRFMLAALVLFVHSYVLLYGEGGEKDFSKINTMGWLEKRVFLLQWGILKNGFVRNMGLMWKI